jgi:hypothetical protein
MRHLYMISRKLYSPNLNTAATSSPKKKKKIRIALLLPPATATCCHLCASDCTCTPLTRAPFCNANADAPNFNLFFHRTARALRACVFLGSSIFNSWIKYILFITKLYEVTRRWSAKG